MDLIKVSGTARTSAVPGAIAGVIREHQRAEVQAIGSQAVNQAVKALALARRYLRRDALDIVVVPEFVDINIAEQRGMSGLRGHRSVGGIRASIYNAFPEDGVRRLVELLHELEP